MQHRYGKSLIPIRSNGNVIAKLPIQDWGSLLCARNIAKVSDNLTSYQLRKRVFLKMAKEGSLIYPVFRRWKKKKMWTKISNSREYKNITGYGYYQSRLRIECFLKKEKFIEYFDAHQEEMRGSMKKSMENFNAVFKLRKPINKK